MKNQRNPDGKQALPVASAEPSVRTVPLISRHSLLPLLLWSALVGVSLFSSLRQLDNDTRELALAQGREVFRLIQAMRLWSAQHGGVFVVQTERDPPNPYLQHPERSTVTVKGTRLTLLNPAYMTRQMAGVLESSAGIRIHLTSLKLLNPGNQADAWEAAALQSFEQGVKENLEIGRQGGSTYARYMAPLFMEQPCLVCHRQQNYKLGEVRGGLSINWSVEPILASVQATRELAVVVHTLVWLLVSILLALGIRRIQRNMALIEHSQRQLAETNATLETEVENRTGELKKSNEALQAISDFAPGVVYQYRLRPDGTTCIPYASERFYDLFKLRPEEVRDDAKYAFALVHPDDVAGIVASTATSARELTPWHHRFRLRYQDGKERWVQGDTMPLREQDGAVLWNGFIADITAQKAQEEALAQSEEQLRLMFERILHGVVIQNGRGEIIAANPMAEQILGLSLAQMQGITSLDPQWRCVHEDGSDFPGEAHPAMQALRSGNPVKDVVMGVFNPVRNELRWILASAMPQFKPGQTAAYEVFTTFSDITERKEAEAVMKQHKVVIDTAQDGFWMTDAQGNLLEVNQAYANMTGYGIDELLKMNISDLEAHENPEDVKAHVDKIIGQGFDKFETRHRHKNGRDLDIEISATFLPEVQRFFVFCRDIGERKLAEQAMRSMAYYDALTGLPNRRMLSDRLALAMEASKRSGRYGALLFLDLDNFKPLNDAHGHNAGDRLLQVVAHRIKMCVRTVDTVARYGGDEFVVMLTELDEAKASSAEQAKAIAEKIRAAIGEPYRLKVDSPDGTHVLVEHRCSASIGVVPFINHESNEQELMKCADKAMYQAKESGRNRIFFMSSKAGEVC